MTTCRELIKSAFRLSRVIDPGETPTAAEMDDALFALQSMLGMWAAQPNSTFALNTTPFTCIVNQQDYTVGTGGDIPQQIERIEQAWLRISNVDYNLVLYTEFEFNSIASKESTGMPLYMAYVRGGDGQLGTIKLWPKPNQQYAVRLSCIVPFTALTLDSVITYPVEYIEAIRSNLALSICMEFGVQPNDYLARLASDSKRVVDNLNAAHRLTPVGLTMPNVQRYGFNWITGLPR